MSEFHWKDETKGSSECNFHGLELSVWYVGVYGYWGWTIHEWNKTHREDRLYENKDKTLSSVKAVVEREAMNILSSRVKRKHETENDFPNKRQKTEGNAIVIRDPSLMGIQQSVMELLLTMLVSIPVDVLRLLCQYICPVDILGNPKTVPIQGPFRGMWMDGDTFHILSGIDHYEFHSKKWKRSLDQFPFAKNTIAGLPRYRHVIIDNVSSVWKYREVLKLPIKTNGWRKEWGNLARVYQRQEMWSFSFWRNDFSNGESRIIVHKGDAVNAIRLETDSASTIDMLPSATTSTFLMTYGCGYVKKFDLRIADSSGAFLSSTLTYDRRQTVLSVNQGPPMVFIRDIGHTEYFGVFTFYNGIQCHVAIYQHENPRLLWEYSLDIPSVGSVPSHLHQNLLITSHGIAYLVVTCDGSDHLYELTLF